jgi:2-aminobenzoate-CoA ligase
MANIGKHHVTVLTGIPIAYRKLVEMKDLAEYDLSGVRLCTAGGDALGEQTFDAWMARTGLQIWENLGTTESYSAFISNRMGARPKRNSIGRPLPGFEVRVLDEKRNLCEPGKAGSMHFRGPTGIIYWNPRGQEGRLMEAQRNSVRDGWNKVGDAVYRDEEDYLFFVSREDDMIKSAGYRLSPREIEEVLNQHPLVQEAAVIGVPDPLLGQDIKAYVILKDAAVLRPELEQEMKDYCRKNIAVYKIPRRFEFVSHLPKTLSGKIQRKRLAEPS